MTKEKRIDVISNIVSFAIMFGIRYLCRLEYNRGFADGKHSANSMTTPNEDRARHIADVFAERNVI